MSIFLYLAVAGAVYGHGRTTSDYVSRVVAVDPSNYPIHLEVHGGDESLQISNAGPQDLLVFGYNDDPYVRIGPDGVFVNTNSTTYYTNKERFGRVEIPKNVGEGKPVWKRQKTGVHAFEYHDHRVHWMLESLPPGVDEGSSARQQVSKWNIDMEYGGKPVVARGDLAYVGGTGFLEKWWKVVAIVALALIGIVVTFTTMQKLDGGNEDDT